MSTLYRPNHRCRGPIESEKRNIFRSSVRQGLQRIHASLSDAYASWDAYHAARMQGGSSPSMRQVKIVDLHPPSGSFLTAMRMVIVGERRIDVLTAVTWEEALEKMKEADALAVGVGGLPAASIPYEELTELCGRTPLVLGRRILPYIEAAWPLLGIYASDNGGTTGHLQAQGLEPRVYPGQTAPHNTVIPDDGLAAHTALIRAGDHPHRFYAAWGLHSLVLSIDAPHPSQTTAHERQWCYYAIEQWLCPTLLP